MDQEIKYCELVNFGKSIGQIIKDCQYIINKQKMKNIYQLVGLERLALSILLMDHCNFRVGSRKYKNSTGLLTIETDHFDPKTEKIEFLGKKQVLNKCILTDKKIIEDIRKLWKEVDKYEITSKSKKDFLFRFDEGKQNITSDDLNAFLKLYNPSFSAKMFRTWKANYYFLEAINKMKKPESDKEIMTNIKNAVEYSASKLYHTTAVSKRNYINNKIIEYYKENSDEMHKKIGNFDLYLTKLFKKLC